MTKEKAETKWKGHELEKLDQAVYLFDVSKIKTWQVNAVHSILSALGKWLLQILKATSVHNTSDGIEVHIKVGQTRINILKPVSNERMLDVAWLALEHGAPLIPDDLSWNEIKENTKKKKEALAKMIELLSSFNDQMRGNWRMYADPMAVGHSAASEHARAQRACRNCRVDSDGWRSWELAGSHR